MASFLEGVPVSALYSSPRLRARQTAGILNEWLHCPTIHISRLIDEVLTGYEGQPGTILGGKFNFYDVLAREGDESISMVALRMARFLNLMHRRHREQTIVAVSHADPIMILRAAILGLPLVIDILRGQYYPAKGSIMQFSFTSDVDKPIIVYRTPAPETSSESDAKPASNLEAFDDQEGTKSPSPSGGKSEL